MAKRIKESPYWQILEDDPKLILLLPDTKSTCNVRPSPVKDDDSPLLVLTSLLFEWYSGYLRVLNLI